MKAEMFFGFAWKGNAFISACIHATAWLRIINFSLQVSVNCSHKKAVQSSFNPLKTNVRSLYLKAQSVPRCKHFVAVIKTNQFML